MFADTKAYSSFAVDDLRKAEEFYGRTLGIETTVLDEEAGLLVLRVAGGRNVLVYARPNHRPAEYTVLNFPVDDVEGAVDELAGRGVSFERYEGFDQDERGIARGGGRGPDIAWFKDPAGNVLAVLEDQGDL